MAGADGHQFGPLIVFRTNSSVDGHVMTTTGVPSSDSYYDDSRVQYYYLCYIAQQQAHGGRERY